MSRRWPCSGNGHFQIAYVARAVTPGDFYLPGVELRDMYRPTLYARSGGARTTVQIAGQDEWASEEDQNVKPSPARGRRWPRQGVG